MPARKRKATSPPPPRRPPPSLADQALPRPRVDLPQPPDITQLIPLIPGLHPFYLWVHSQMIKLTSAALAYKPKPSVAYFRCHCCLSSHKLTVHNGAIVEAALEATPTAPNTEEKLEHAETPSWELLEAFLEQHFHDIFGHNGECESPSGGENVESRDHPSSSSS
jgi:hypothetical protein